MLPEGAHVPDGMLAVGVPARVVRPAPSTGNAMRYVHNGERFRHGLSVLAGPDATPALHERAGQLEGA